MIVEPGSLARFRATRFGSRVRRLAGYSSWMLLDQCINIGAPRLLLYPVLAAQLGAESFGSLILALAFISMVGQSPSNGLTGHVIRSATLHDASSQDLLMRTVFVLSGVSVVPILAFLLLGSAAIGRMYDDPAVSTVLPFLGLYLLSVNLIEPALTIHRVKRNFAFVALVHSLVISVLFLSVPLSRLRGASGVGQAYALGGAVGIMVLLAMDRRRYFATPIFSKSMARSAVSVWLPLSLSSFLAFTAGSLDRLVLGYWWPATEVAAFFAAAGTARIFVLPVSQASDLVLSLLGKVNFVGHFRRSFYVLYAVGACLVAACMFGFGSLLGEIVLNTLYPGLKSEALPLWNYAVAAESAVMIQMGCRPFIVKFASPRLLPKLTGLSLVARTIPLFIMVPTFGRMGAVQAMLIGSAVSAAAWLAAYVKTCLLHR